jgi:hypothetical protein
MRLKNFLAQNNRAFIAVIDCGLKLAKYPLVAGVKEMLLSQVWAYPHA